jgi:hypothetical protein
MNWRKMTSLIVAWSFIALVISGVVLYIVPHGRVAYWTDWSLWGLIKDSWAEIHIVFGAIFIVMGIIHIFYNWKPLKKYMVERAKGHMHLRKELVLATVISVSVLIGSIANLPPVSWLFDLNATIKQAWLSSPDFEPPYGHAEETSLAGFSRRMGMDINKITEELKSAGFKLTTPRDSLKTIAIANGTNALGVYRVIKKFERAPIENASRIVFTVELVEEKFSGTGLGQKTIGQICSQIKFPLTKARDRLSKKNVKWQDDEKMKDIAERYEVGAIDILKAILVPGFFLKRS